MDTFAASTTSDWKVWLADNARSEKEVWLVIHHKDSATPSVRYHEAIEHALCFGWIDSQARLVDAGRSQLRFTPGFAEFDVVMVRTMIEPSWCRTRRSGGEGATGPTPA